jgi:hypothetical protein
LLPQAFDDGFEGLPWLAGIGNNNFTSFIHRELSTLGFSVLIHLELAVAMQKIDLYQVVGLVAERLLLGAGCVPFELAIEAVLVDNF